MALIDKSGFSDAFHPKIGSEAAVWNTDCLYMTCFFDEVSLAKAINHYKAIVKLFVKIFFHKPLVSIYCIITGK